MLGGSFTGRLEVDPSHLRDMRQRTSERDAPQTEAGSDRPRRIRDAVEAALSDILLLGTDEQVRLAARAANQLAAGEPIQTGELVVSLRDFIRKALDLSEIPGDVEVPVQGSTRPSSGSGKSSGRDDGSGRRSGGGSGGGAAREWASGSAWAQDAPTTTTEPRT